MKKILIIVLIMIALTFSFLNVNGLETTKEELKRGIDYEEKMSLSSHNYFYDVNKVCKHQNGFVVVGKSDDEEEITIQLDFYLTYPYIAYYDNNGLVWAKVDKSIGHGEYKDAVVVGNEVVAIGTYETGDGRTKLLMTRFNEYGNVKARVEFDCNKSTFGYNILYENNKYYLIGLTNSTHFLFDTNNVSNKIFVLKLGSSFQKEDIVFLHNGDNSNLIDACMANGIIYIHGILSGNGEYDIDSILPVDSLFSIDSSLDHIAHQKIIRHKFLKIACNEDDVYVFRADDKLSDLCIDEYDYSLTKRNFIMPYKDFDYTINNIAVSSSSLHEPISCYISSSSGSHDFSTITSVGLELDVIDNETKEEDGPFTADGVLISMAIIIYFQTSKIYEM